MGVRKQPAPGPRSASPELFLLAGFPNPLHSAAKDVLTRYGGPGVRVIAAPSPGDYGRLYPPQTVDTLVRSSTEFAIVRRGSPDVAPKSIALFYIPATDDEDLFRGFDFSVFPVPLQDLEGFDPGTGRQRRHLRRCFDDALKTAVARRQREFMPLKRKIDSRGSGEPLLLPPRNFRINGQEDLASVFLQLRRGDREWDGPIREVHVEEFAHDDLPHFLGLREVKRLCRDARSIVFPPARPSQMHGNRRGFGADSESEEQRDYLRSHYRFGVPLAPGFHHDAQLEGGRSFHDTPFDCSKEGPVRVSGSHANVYPNDYVRADRKEKITS